MRTLNRTLKTVAAFKAAGFDIEFPWSIRETDIIEELLNSGAMLPSARIEKLAECALFFVYILVLINPKTGKRCSFRHAKTYTGITVQLDRRFEDHISCNGRGSNLTQAVTEAGLELKIAAVFMTDDLDFEFAIKDFHGGDIAMAASNKRLKAALKRNKQRKDVVIEYKRARREARIQASIMKKREKDPDFMLDWFQG